MHLIVQRLVDAVVYFLKLRNRSAAVLPQGAVFAVLFAASVNVLAVAFAVGLLPFV